METSTTTKAIMSAMVLASAEMPKIPFNKVNPYFNSKYADLAQVIEVTKPILAKYGLAIIQSNLSHYTVNTNYVGVSTTLIHESGEFITDNVLLPLPESNLNDTKQKQINYAQVAGQYNTYLRRYGWVSMCGVIAEDDDDGNSAGGNNQNQYRSGNQKQVPPPTSPKVTKPKIVEQIPFTDDDPDYTYAEEVDDEEVAMIVARINQSAFSKRPATEKQINLVGMLLHQAIPDEETYAEVIKTIGGQYSVKQLEPPLITAIIDWLKPYNEGGKYLINAQTLQELNKIILYVSSIM